MESKKPYGFIIVVIGIIVVAVVFLATMYRFSGVFDIDPKTPIDGATLVITAMSSLFGVIGTLVGAFFGVRVGLSGKEKSDDLATEALSRLDPETGKEVKNVVASRNR